MDWIGDHLWVAWLGAAFVLAVAEMASLDLVLLMLAAGAVGGMAVALATDNVIAQILIAAVVALAMLGLVRPNLVHRLHGGPELRIGPQRLIGLRTVTAGRISALEPGRIKVDGQDWRAEPYDDTTVIEPGTPVEVLQVRGATAYVHPIGRLEN
jgi:membrane protein implicated in regulation of membrane protease activity